jgi:hypothetical protein
MNAGKLSFTIVNTDGSVDYFFCQAIPSGKEVNCILTIPGKEWFAMLKIYGPLEPWFEKTWQIGEF